MDPDPLSPLLLSIIRPDALPLSAYISLAVAIGLLFCSAFVSASEVAFFALTPTQRERLNDEQSDDVQSKAVNSLLQMPQELLATILIANNFVNVVLIVLLTNFTTALFDFSSAPVLGFVVETVIITFLLLLFGEIMPKIFANQNALRMSKRAARPLMRLHAVLAPFVRLLVRSTSVVNNRLSKHQHNTISMDDISQAIELTTNDKDEDKDMLEGIVRFGDIEVSDIMCPRVDIVDLDIKSNYKQVLQTIIESGYSRIPVYSGSSDQIKGILYSKDLLPHIEKPANFKWQTLIRPAYFVPESKKIDELLSEFQENKVHLAIVVDEYGGTSGLVTMEDILEEIVGDISDEYDEEQKQYTRIDDHTYIFEGKTLLNDFFKIIDADEDDFQDITDEVETLAGLVLELKGEIPKRGTKVHYGEYSFEVLAVDKRRIKSIKVIINPKSAGTENTAE